MAKAQAEQKPAIEPKAPPVELEVRRLRARVALLEQQIQTLLSRQGIKWVVKTPAQH